MNAKQFFKTAHAIAHVLEGDYQARFKMACELIKAKRLNEVNELIDLDTLEPIDQDSSVLSHQVPNKMPSNRKRVTSRKPKQAVQSEPIVKIEYKGLPSIILERFTDDQCNTIDVFISRYVETANAVTKAVHMDAKRYNFEDGMKALENCKEVQDLQGVMIAYFLRDQSERMVKKFLDMGIGYKKPNKAYDSDEDYHAYIQRNSYMNASSNHGSISTFEVGDILNDLIVDAYRLTFNEKMFDKVEYVMTSIFYRISNIVQVRTRELRNQTKVVAAKKQYIQEEGTSMSSEEEAMNLALEMGVFSDAELNIIKLRIEGYNKQEINKLLGKRTDRAFEKMEKSYSNAI